MARWSIPEINPELELANCFVEQTGSHIFLTGKAGTGKTTFLKTLQQETTKRLVVTAPTGVAAINAGGVTLHSFFQLPLGPFISGSGLDHHSSWRQYRFSRDKQEIIRCLDLLVIDEISMVRADILDAVDAVLRRYRSRHEPFGGVQLLLIGDLHQLPPVVKQEDWELLSDYYDSVYFFSSRALAQSGFTIIELKHIYRQTDPKFIDILNQLRDNRLDDTSLSELNRRYIKNFIPENDRGFITLTTHNASAERLNDSRLQALDGHACCFRAEIRGEFPKNNYPAPEALEIKKGSQVMCLRNDTSTAKRYFNGKIGQIVKFTSDRIEIICPGDSETIIVEPVIWENIKYTLNREKMKMEEAVIGTFKQYPLKLAWAITIHKSQGLTFQNAVIDSEASFMHGQAYVALSRCASLDGVVLSSPISSHGIDPDTAIRDFDRRIRQNPPSPDHLLKAKTVFQQEILIECFDFKRLQNIINRLVGLVLENIQSITVLETEDPRQITGLADVDIFSVAGKFRRQLQQIFQAGNLPESDPQILERTRKASIWFQEQLTETILKPLQNLQVETDSAVQKALFKESLYQLKKEIAIKLESVKSLENGFHAADYQRRVFSAGIDRIIQNDRSAPTINITLKDDDIQAIRFKKRVMSGKKISATKQASFDLFNRGLTIEKIAKKRGLVRSTIEKHLCVFIELGQLDIDRLLPKKKQDVIQKHLKNDDTNTLSAVKEKLGKAYSYGEIRMVLAGRNTHRQR